MKHLEYLSSWEQFERDFGEFPPNGIKASEKLKKETFAIKKMTLFNIITSSHKLSVTSIKSALPQNKKLRNLSNSGNVEENYRLLSKEVTALIEEFKQALIDIKSKKFTKTLKSAVLFFLMPFMILFALLMLVLFYFIFFTKSAYRKLTNTSGYFSKIDNVNQIFIKSPVFNRSVIAIHYGELISHEHMHLRQHIKRDSIPIDTLLAFESPADNSFLTNSARSKKYINYLINRHETEVRINELLICYYRQHRIIPSNFSEFIKMLLSFQNLYKDVEILCPEFLEAFNVKLSVFSQVRSDFSVTELSHIFIFIKDKDTLKRYITEVLPVMYAHLLFYYGDDNACSEFFKTIPSINMYQCVYGKSV